MAHLQIIRTGETRLERWRRTVRSLWLGPYNSRDPVLARLFGGRPSSSGIAVSEDTALNYAAVWQAVSLIAGEVGSLPLIFYKRLKGGGKERYTDHPLYALLHDAPNPEMSSMVWRETMQAHLLTWGNAYAEIARDQVGRPAALWPLLPNMVQPFRDERDQRLRYRVAGVNSQDLIFEASDILHVPGLGWDGTMGYSPIRKAAESLGLLAASEHFGATFFGQGSTFGGIIRHPKVVLGGKAEKNLRDSIDSYHKGSDKAHRFLILEEGMEYQKLGVDPNAAQFLETRKFQITEVARWFNLPVHKLREMDNSSVRANIEQESLDFYTGTLRPWLVRWEQEINRKLVSPRERNIQFAEFLLEGVLRGDMKSRYDAYAVGRQWGWLSVDDIRERENMNPLPNQAGTIYLVPQNMAPADRINEVIDAQIKEPEPSPKQLPAGPMMDDEEEEEDDRAALLAQLEAQRLTIVDYQQRLELAHSGLNERQAEVVRLDEGWRAAVAAGEERGRADSARIAELQAECREHSQKIAELERERNTLSETLHAKTVEAETSAEDAQAARTVLAETQAALEQVKASYITAAQDLGTARGELASAAQEHATAVATLQTELDTERAAHEATQLTLDQVRALWRANSDELAEVRTQIESAQQVAADANDAAAHAVAEMNHAIAQREQAEAVRDDALAQKADAELRATAATALCAAATDDAHAEIAKREQADTALATARDAMAQHLTALITANRDVMCDAMSRMVRREAEKARSKRATPEKLRAWAQTFYDDHEIDLWCDALQPAMALHLALIGSPESPVEKTRELVRNHMEISKRQILAVAACDPDDYPAAFTTTLQRWEQERAQHVADSCLREELAYVRAYR